MEFVLGPSIVNNCKSWRGQQAFASAGTDWSKKKEVGLMFLFGGS